MFLFCLVQKKYIVLYLTEMLLPNIGCPDKL